MSFTDRYIKLPIRIYDKSQEDTMGKPAHECDMINMEVRINPFKIESYRSCIPDDQFDEQSLTATSIIMESGENHMIYLAIEKFEAILNLHL